MRYHSVEYMYMTVTSDPKLPNYRNIKRYVILTVGMLVVLMVSFFGWKAYSEYQLTVQAAESKGKAYCRALKEHAERTFSETDAILLNVLDHVAMFGDISAESPEKLKVQLNKSLGSAPHIGALVLVNREGILFAHSLDANLKQADVSDRDYYIYHRKNPADRHAFISQPLKSRINGKWRFTISRAIIDSNGSFAGIVAAAMDLDYFSKFYRSLDLGDKGRILITRNDGKLLVNEPFNEKDLAVDFSKSNLITRFLPKSPQGIYHIPKGKALLERDERIIAYESLAAFPVTVMANQSMTTVIEPWRERNIRFALIVLTSVGALFILTIALVRQLKNIELSRNREIDQQRDLESAAEAWRTTFDSVEDAVWVMEMDRKITRCNKATGRIFGKDLDQILNRPCCEIAHGGTLPIPACPFSVAISTRHRASKELEINNRWFKVSVDPILTSSGEVCGAVHIVTDITSIKEAIVERELLEQKLAQAQKMEAIGHLAGGIAHDFNNLLTPIMGYAEIAATELSADSPVASRITGILTAANKAKALTLQLLAFSRSKSTVFELHDLNEIIIALNDILRRTIRESIRIELHLQPDGALINADRTQIEQILINLTVNSQDALGENQGVIRIETCTVTMEGEPARLHPGMSEGVYHILSFSDNGCGMSQDVIDHAFEPFFTTKVVGHGTGLGLATVYGIVKQHNAFIGVSSHTGEGTTFTIYFPAAKHEHKEYQSTQEQCNCRRIGEGTIMLVEDNEMVRDMVQEMLIKIGYRVIPVAKPEEASGIFDATSESIDLLISDIVMPGMNGPELYEQLLVRKPNLKVLFISGYPINPTQRRGTIEDEITYLQKPFTAEALMERIRLVL